MSCTKQDVSNLDKRNLIGRKPKCLGHYRCPLSPGPTLPYPRAFPSMIQMPQKRSSDSLDHHSASATSRERGGSCPAAAAAAGKKSDETMPSMLFLVGGFIGTPDMTLNDVIPVSVPDLVRLDLRKGETVR